MNFLEMAHYKDQYISACNRVSRAQAIVDGIHAAAAQGIDQLDELPEAEEELRQAKEERDRLWYLYTCGQPKPETPPDTFIPLSPFGNPISPQ